MPKDYFSWALSRRVDEVFKATGQKQEDFAKSIGLSRSRFNKLLHSLGTESWAVDTVFSVASRYNISLDDVRQEAERLRDEERQRKPDEGKTLSAEFRSAEATKGLLAKVTQLHRAVRRALKAKQAEMAFQELNKCLDLIHPVLFTSGDRRALEILSTILELFFEVLWHTPLKVLGPDSRAFLLHWAGSTLRARGRLSEAAEAMSAGFKLSQHNMERVGGIPDGSPDNEAIWQGAVLGCINLSTLWLFIGNLTEAMKWATEGCTLAGNSAANAALVDVCQTIHEYLAYLHQPAKSVTQPRPLLPEDEYAKIEKRFQFVIHLRQYFADQFSIARGDHSAVTARLAGRLHLGQVRPDSVLDHLSFGMAQSRSGEVDDGGLTHDAVSWLDEAVEELTRLGHNHHLPMAFLARAEKHRSRGSYLAATTDIEAVFAIAIPDKMHLYHADALIAEAWVEFDQGKPEEAQRLLDLAESYIRDETTGYGWGDQKIASLRAQILGLHIQ